MKGHVLHRARVHFKVPGCSLVWKALLTLQEGKGLTLCEAQPMKQAQTTTPGTTCPTGVLEPARKNNPSLNTYRPFTDMHREEFKCLCVKEFL